MLLATLEKLRPVNTWSHRSAGLFPALYHSLKAPEASERLQGADILSLSCKKSEQDEEEQQKEEDPGSSKATRNDSKLPWKQEQVHSTAIAGLSKEMPMSLLSNGLFELPTPLGAMNLHADPPLQTLDLENTPS